MPEGESRLARVLPGFTRRRIDANGVAINAMAGGDGPLLLLLHGHPQTLACWHRVVPALARRHTVVVTDLRGYGDSAKPGGGPDHIAYSKREMARNQVAVMHALGFDHFLAAGHDRGGRVLHRLLLDFPGVVTRAALFDIAPNATMFSSVTKEFATRYIWWFFLIQPEPLPETLIGNNLEFYPYAVCEDDRAAAGIDLVHDAADRERKIEVPLLVLWGAKGVVGTTWDVLASWREKAGDVRGEALPRGHYLPEEAFELVVDRLESFFA